jgi:hypothetical protein
VRCLVRLSLLVCLLHAADATGQVGAPVSASPRWAGVSVASVTGPDAIFRNPARIDLGGSKAWLSVGAASAFVGGPLLQFKHYNRAFTDGNVIDQMTGREIVQDWFGDPTLRTKKSAGVSVAAVPIAGVFDINSRQIAFAIRTRALGNIAINGGWLDLLLVGMEEPRSVPLNGDTGLALMTDVATSMRHRLRSDVVAGLTVRVVLGHEYAEGRLTSTAAISDRSLTHTFDYVVYAAGSAGRDLVSRINVFDLGGTGAMLSPGLTIAGLGLGLDFGLDYARTERTNISFSLTDIGSVRWTRDAVKHVPVNHSFYFEGIDFDLDELKEQFENDIGAYIENKVDSLARDAYEETVETRASFSRLLPAAANVGVSHRVFGARGALDIGASIPLNRAIGQASAEPRLSVGLAYRLGTGSVLFPVGAGVQFGSGALALGFSFGVEAGLYAFSFGLSGSPRSDLLGGGGHYAVAVSALQLRF